MKTLMKTGMLLLLCMLASVSAFAQDPIAGIWEGKLEVAPGNVISVQFTLAQEGGAWTAVLNSPDMGAIKNIKADTVTFAGDKLDITVNALSGSYSGMLANGSFTGKWTQPGSVLDMNLLPFTATVMSDETIATLLGQWHGKLIVPGITLNINFHFERNEAGEFVGFIQQIDTSPQKVPVSDISLENNELFFRVTAANAEYRGTMTADGFNGHLKQNGQEMELNVVKGEYVAEQIKLALTDADFDKLSGSWTGTLGPLTLVLRVERAADGSIAAFIDSPTQGASGLKVTTATLTDNKLAVALTVPPAQYNGELDGNTLTGSWTQGGMSNPLNLTRE